MKEEPMGNPVEKPAAELIPCRVCKTKPLVTSDSRRMVVCCEYEYYCEIGCPNHAQERVFAASLDSAIDAQREAEVLWNRRMMEGIDPATGKRDWAETCRLCGEGELEPLFCPFYGEPNGCNSPHGEHPSITQPPADFWRASKSKEFCEGDCNSCEAIHNRQVSVILNALYELYGEDVYRIVQHYCPNLTCCADCSIDDFCHSPGCELRQEARRCARAMKGGEP